MPAALGAYLRDLGQVMGFLLTLWFFLTPICYPVESLPGGALPVLTKKPLFVLAAAFFVGHAFFYKLKRSFADVI